MAALNSKVKKDRYPGRGIGNQDAASDQSYPERDAAAG